MESVKATYATKTNRVCRQELVREVHRHTKGYLLTDFAEGLVFTIKNEKGGSDKASSFDLVHLKPKDK